MHPRVLSLQQFGHFVPPVVNPFPPAGTACIPRLIDNQMGKRDTGDLSLVLPTGHVEFILLF